MTEGFPLAPGAVIGILGGGQLGRMLALAAGRLGFDVVILTPELDAPASRVARETLIAPFDDPDALGRLADLCDVITYEFENVPAAAAARLKALGAPVAPNDRTLAVAQDRVAEKTFLNEAGVRTVAFLPVNSAQDAAAAATRLGAPALMKTRKEGYDGKGQAWVETAGQAGAIFEALGGVPCILEAQADFVRELSVIAARSRDGALAVYPLGENRHEGGILRRTVAPAPASPDLAAQAERIAAQILTRLDYVGVIGIELFELADGRLLANEIAPRVHNTGHWTQDGCQVCQFEQHIRAVAGWPLGPTDARARVEMLNLLGEEAGAWLKLAGEPETRLHLYGKRETKPGRKMGHINRLSRL